MEEISGELKESLREITIMDVPSQIKANYMSRTMKQCPSHIATSQRITFYPYQCSSIPVLLSPASLDNALEACMDQRSD